MSDNARNMPKPASFIIENAAMPETWFHEGCFISELLNDDRDPGVSVARARVAPGQTTRWHALLNTVERYIVLAGQGRVELGDGTRARMRPDDVVVIPAGMAQRIHNELREPLIFLAVCTPRFRPDCYCDLEEQDGDNV